MDEPTENTPPGSAAGTTPDAPPGADSHTPPHTTKGLSVRQKIGIGFGGLILLMTISIGITLVKLTDVADATHSVIEERQPAANLFQRLAQDLNLATTLLHSYLQTGEPAHRKDFAIVEQDIMEGITTGHSLKIVHENGGKARKQLLDAEQLFVKFRDYAARLYALRDNNANNRGLLLAQNTVQPLAAEFLGVINLLLSSEDIDPRDPKKLVAYTTLQELRYVWVQMMSSLRLFIVTQGVNDRANFDTFNDHAGQLLDELTAMDVDLGFGELQQLVTLREAYVSNLQPVFDLFATDNWRADAYLIKTEVNPLLEELRGIFEGIADEQLHQASNSGEVLTEVNQQIQLSTIIILVVALVLGVLLAVRITGGIVPPIQRLMAAAEGVAHGDLNAEVMVTSNDEIGQLGRSFNAMVNDLRNAALKEQTILDELQDLNQQLESRVQARTRDLEQSEIKIRAILDNIGEGIVVLDENGTIESLNPAAENIFAMKEANAIGLHSALLIANSEADDAADSDHYNDETDGAFRSSSNQQPKEYQGLRADGSTFPLEFVVSAMKVGDKRLRVCILRDVSVRKETEATLADAQGQLVDAAHKSGMADMATGVLHNIGNILNSVNLAGEEIHRISSASKISGLLKANDLLLQHQEDRGEFLTQDPRGQKLPDYFITMGKVLSDEINEINKESKELIKKTTMMKEVISTQQAYAKSGFHSEQLNLSQLVEDALKIQEASLKKWGVKLEKNYADIPECTGQKSKLLQVITNLVKNAKEAMNDNDQYNRPKEMRIEIGMNNDKTVYLTIKDNGCGINEQQLTKIFNHGFTTKETGHGFGLHTCANAMTEMKGALKVESEGVQKGATFTVIIPVDNPATKAATKSTSKVA
ncbi:MAG: ATP-binding protein [Gammaproteobacteria bacterium]|nr:ATP-binding protein [Gammaproteobacteria bacterium]